MANTQLLCTFTSDSALPAILNEIRESYDVSFDCVYVLENVDDPSVICCTYNVVITDQQNRVPVIIESTIALHRKKMTNTLYTINALNMLVAELNDGVLDKKFQVPWENYRNTILVTAYGRLKKIPTKLKLIINLDDEHE